MDRRCKRYSEVRLTSADRSISEEDSHFEAAATPNASFECVGLGVVRKQVELNVEERQYLLAVERGDIATVQQYLARAKVSCKNLNVNCVDPLGRTALLVAIENDNIEMIELLLRYDVDVSDALLHAINEDNVEATQLLLAHEQRQRMTPTSPLELESNKYKAAQITEQWKKLTISRETNVDGSFILEIKDKPADTLQRSSWFTPDITPITLAAHRDNFEIIKILLDRGDRILKPHDVRCGCGECVHKSTEDSLNHSQSRINAYRALASPSLMVLSSIDPILTAFELSWELRILSRLENELKVEYEALSKQCQTFAVDLLDQTRGSKELEILLNYDRDGSSRDGGWSSSTDRGYRMKLARLKLAIKYKQKKFVAHASCQQLLASLWYEGLLGFRRRHVVSQAIITVTICLLFPIFVVVYMVAPKSAAGQFIRRPFIKFLCHSSSYITFLFLLILASQRIDSIINLASGDLEETQTKMTREVRGAPPTSIEWMILAYVCGLVWAEIKQLWDQGVKSYVHDMWNILDFTTNSLYIATYALKLVAYLRVEEEKRLGQFHLARLTRDKWDAYDPTLISEGLFAAANIFSSLKVIYIFTVNPHLGPLQISLGRMVIDIMKFLFIALLVCFSYSCGVNQLYWYYAEERTKNCTACLKTKDNPADCKCDRTLANLFEIIQTLYFAIYGLVEISHFELKEKHEFTQFVGKLMYGTYCGIMTIVLINMFIAMLSSSFQKISDDQDTEWKFARSRLWMSYFEEGGTVPAPFNIIPTPKTLWYILKWIKEKMCIFSKTAKNNKWQGIRAVIRDLVKRYVMNRQRSQSADGVSEDDVNEIKQDISSFRYELLDILRKNGMTLPPTSSSSFTSSSMFGNPGGVAENTLNIKHRKGGRKVHHAVSHHTSDPNAVSWKSIENIEQAATATAQNLRNDSNLTQNLENTGSSDTLQNQTWVDIVATPPLARHETETDLALSEEDDFATFEKVDVRIHHAKSSPEGSLCSQCSQNYVPARGNRYVTSDVTNNISADLDSLKNLIPPDNAYISQESYSSPTHAVFEPFGNDLILSGINFADAESTGSHRGSDVDPLTSYYTTSRFSQGSDDVFYRTLSAIRGDRMELVDMVDHYHPANSDSPRVVDAPAGESEQGRDRTRGRNKKDILDKNNMSTKRVSFRGLDDD